MGPPQLSPQCGDNVPIRKCLGKLNHAPEILFTEAASELAGQMSPHCGDNLLAVFGTFLAENLMIQASPHAPVEHRERSIGGLGELFPRVRDHASQLTKQAIRGFGQVVGLAHTPIFRKIFRSAISASLASASTASRSATISASGR